MIKINEGDVFQDRDFRYEVINLIDNFLELAYVKITDKYNGEAKGCCRVYLHELARKEKII